MRLYLDLNKAVSVPNTGTDQIDAKRAARNYEESFNRRHSGVLGADLSENVEDEDKKDSKKDKQDYRESYPAPDVAAILKSFTSDLRDQINRSLPNEREVEYLTSVCGFTTDDVVKGRARISGYERTRFNHWLHQRLQKSISRLL